MLENTTNLLASLISDAGVNGVSHADAVNYATLMGCDAYDIADAVLLLQAEGFCTLENGRLTRV